MRPAHGKNSIEHLSDYLQKNTVQTPDKLAVDDGKSALTWRELWQEVEPMAFRLAKELGSEQQRIVGLLMPNGIKHVITYLSIVHAGHIALPIDVIYKALEIDAVIDQVKPELVITDSVNRPRITTNSSPIIIFEKLPKADDKKAKLLRVPVHKQIANLFFTSGTTGKPKLAPNTHANHVWNIQACSEVWHWNSDESLLISLRLSHMHGLVMGLSGALFHGNSLFLRDRFDAEETLELLALGQITQFTHGPLAYAKLLEVKDAHKYDLSKVRLFICGSAPLPPEIWQRFKDVFGHEILEVYGTTETGRIASNPLNQRIAGSPGEILPGVDVKIDDRGEVLVKSPGVFPGYFGNLQATKAATSQGGWWRTGDLGEIRGRRLVLKGRLQEKIRKSGYTISPRDIEWALYKLPAIKEAYVMGLQRPQKASDLLVYYLVSAASEDEIIAFCKDNLPSVWRPDKIIFVEEIPRTSSGKPQMVRLKALAQSGVL